MKKLHCLTYSKYYCDESIYNNLKSYRISAQKFYKQLEILFRYYDIFPDDKKMRHFYN